MESVYDKALLEVGQDGNFQKRFDFIYNALLAGFWSIAYMNIVLVLAIAPHNCKIPENPGNVSAYEWKAQFIPFVSNAAGETVFSDCLIFNIDDFDQSNQTIGCAEYNYDQTWYKSTVPSDYNWVCDNEINVANVFAYSKIGEMIGAVLSGSFGDMFGRRICYAVAIAMIIVGRVISVFAQGSFLLFVLGCVIASLPSWSAVQSVTVISLEISSPERRTIANTLRSFSFSIGVCIMPLIFWWLRDWKTFIIVTTSTQIPFFLLSWHLIESPRWLWLQGKTKACIKELKKISSQNEKTLTAETEREIITTPVVTSKPLGPLGLFSNGTIALNTTLLLTLWTGVTLTYTVLILNFPGDENANPFLAFAWQSAAEIPGNFAGAWLSDKLGRRTTGLLSFGFSAGLWLLIAFRTTCKIKWIQGWWIGVVLFMLTRLSTVVSYYVTSLFNMELYPTCLRQSGMGLGNVVSSGASAIGPYIIYLGHRVDTRLTGIVLAGSSLLCSFGSLLLPETLNAKLPETIDDAQNFGKSNRYYISLKLKT